MLRFLRIRNLAVIEAVEVEFDSGFTVLTGETGAGKSILVEAVGLLLGGRASSDLVRTGELQATIEAAFDTPEGEELIVRREITSQGRSRAYIGGALATSTALRELSVRLVELHGQHEHQALLDPLTHLPLVDHYAGLGGSGAEVAQAWGEVRALREQLDRTRMDAREREARLDLIGFQLGEIEKAAIRPGEDDELAATRQVLANAERVQGLCAESYAALYERDQAVLPELAGIWRRVGELAAIDPQFAPHLEARDTIKSQLEDLALFLRSYGESVDASPARLQQVEDRLALLERLKRKFGPELEQVIEKGRGLARESALLTGGSERAEDLSKALSEATARYLTAARALSRSRRKAAAKFSTQLEALLAELAMARTRFEVRFSEGELAESAWGESGIDQAEFYVSPNPGEDLRPLARIVSGGELSRVMLALKTLAVTDGAGKTLIFDEVDAGIGGRVADVVGTRLRELGARFQVLCITHLPQIAARGHAQFLIEKQLRGQRTVTTVLRLDEAGRVEEIARMIGGAALSAPVRASARELLTAGAKGEESTKGESESRKRKRG
ncbi:MAG: DNA repair protein RecN [Acidobacteria bacterium]|nr:DNA repair protein RecN [Acidobacteriota bacterium]